MAPGANGPRGGVSASFFGPCRGWVDAVAFSPDGKLVLTGSADNKARLWQAEDGEPVATLRATRTSHAVAFSPDGKLVLTGSFDSTARLWQAADGKLVATLSGHRVIGWLLARRQAGADRLLDDTTARLWHAEDGEPVATLSGTRT